MDINTVSQIVTVVLAVLAVIWHQQRTTDKLRDGLDTLRDCLSDVKERLSRIEGYLHIGMPNDPEPENPDTNQNPNQRKP